MLAAWKNYSFSPQLAGPLDTPGPVCETEQRVSAQLCSWSAFFTPPFPAAVLVAQSCLTLCELTDCSPPGSSVQGIFQARTLEQVAIAFSGTPSLSPTKGLYNQGKRELGVREPCTGMLCSWLQG